MTTMRLTPGTHTGGADHEAEAALYSILYQTFSVVASRSGAPAWSRTRQPGLGNPAPGPPAGAMEPRTGVEPDTA